MTLLSWVLVGRTFFVSTAGNDLNLGSRVAPFRTISMAASVAMPGDTVSIGDGIYRETVRLSKSGETKKPIRFVSENPGKAVVSGTDVLSGWQHVNGHIYETNWPYVFAIDTRNGMPVESHPENEPLWGRAEQVIVDDQQLTPSLNLTQAGQFCADTKAKKIRVWLRDGSDPRTHQVEAATRALTFGCNPWESPKGVHDVQVSGLCFRYGASFAQRPAVWLYGHDNVVENCLIEKMAGAGVLVNGTLRRSIIRDCGHTGGLAEGNGFLNEDSLWLRNAWKPIARGWDSAGAKLTASTNGTIRGCRFSNNTGPGLWLDVWDHDIRITECVFDRNEGTGLFIEICHHIRADHNLAIGNARHASDWGEAGIKIAESRDILVKSNTCANNADGIAFREQGPRRNETDLGLMDFMCQSVEVIDNLCVDNMNYGLGLWYDNDFFGMHPGDQGKFRSEEEFTASRDPKRLYDPRRQSITIDRNVYRGPKTILYGVPWRKRSREFSTLKEFTAMTGFERHGKMGDSGAGWSEAPVDLDSWMAKRLPAWLIPYAR